MKKNYSTMNHDELRAEYKRLNRWLIFPNILIVIIAVAACVMQMLTPFFKVSVTLDSNVVASTVDVIYADYGDDDAIIESDNSVLNTLLTKNNIKEMTSTLDTTLSFEIKSTELLSLAFASDENAEEEIVELLAGLLDHMHISDEIEAALQEMMPKVISTAVTTVVKEQLIASLAEDEELTEEQAEVIDSAASSIESSVQKLATADSVEEVKDEVKVEVQETVTTTMTSLGYTEEDIASVSDEIDAYFDEFINAATDDEGNFSYLTLVANMDTLIEALSSGNLSEEDYEELIEDLTGGDSGSTESDNTESGSTESGSTTELTDEQIAYIKSIVGDEYYDSLTDEEIQYYVNLYNSIYGESNSGSTNAIRYMLTADETDSSTSTSTDEETAKTLAYYIELLDDSEALIREFIGDDLDHTTLQTIKTAALAIFVFVAATAALWAILALLALIHILLPNKKVGMWYVKLFGGLAAIVFYGVPALLIIFTSSFIPTIVSYLALDLDASILTTVFGSISFGGSGLIVLICLLALWIVSIFLCHPVKKKIKRCKRALKGRD